jgi:hypothetical protein
MPHQVDLWKHIEIVENPARYNMNDRRTYPMEILIYYFSIRRLYSVALDPLISDIYKHVLSFN